LIERKNDVMILFKGENGLIERNKRIENKEHEYNSESLLNYHITLLHLMADCADGKNRESEIRLQKLFSMDEILSQLLSPHTIPELRVPLIKMLDEIYINVEISNDDIIHLNTANQLNATTKKKNIFSNSMLWNLLENFIRELKFFTKKGGNVAGSPRFNSNSSSPRNPNSNSSSPRNPTFNSSSPMNPSFSTHKTFNSMDDNKNESNYNGTPATPSSPFKNNNANAANTSIASTFKAVKRQLLSTVRSNRRRSSALPLNDYMFEPKIQVDSNYIYNYQIPFIHKCFHLHFKTENLVGISSEQINVAEDLVIQLIELFKHTAHPDFRNKVFKCIQAMWKKHLRKECQAKIREFFIKQKTNSEISKRRFEESKITDTDEVVYKTYRKYIKLRVLDKIMSRSEFDNLAVLFHNYDGKISVLVNVLRNVAAIGSNDRGVLEMCLHTLEILKKIILRQNQQNKHSNYYHTTHKSSNMNNGNTFNKNDKMETNDSYQNLPNTNLDFISKGLPRVVIELITTPNYEIVKKALEVGEALLFNGSSKIQNEIYQILTKVDSSSFFISLRDRIRIAKGEIKERKNYLKKLREKQLSLLKQRQNNEINKLRQGTLITRGTTKSQNEVIETEEDSEFDG
jgi:hypothetical protein